MNKIEIGLKRPENFATYWPGQYEIFSHFEYAAGIPQALFAITTRKENGKPNVCFSAWSSFTGGAGGYFAVLGGVGKGSHTYENIGRTGEFVINFVGKDYFDACIATIKRNEAATDEMEAGGFTSEPAMTIACPRMREAFLCMECRLERIVDLSEDGQVPLIIGRVTQIAMQEAYAGGIDGKYGENGFMFNIHAPKNLVTGEGKASAVAALQIFRVNEEG